MSLQVYERYLIMLLSQDTYGPRLSKNEVAKIIKYNKTTVKRWKETKDLNDRPRKGRSRVTTVAEAQLIVGLVQQDVDEGRTSQQIQQGLQREGVNVSVRTVRNRLVKAGFKYSRPLSKPLHSKKNKFHTKPPKKVW